MVHLINRDNDFGSIICVNNDGNVYRITIDNFYDDYDMLDITCMNNGYSVIVSEHDYMYDICDRRLNVYMDIIDIIYNNKDINIVQSCDIMWYLERYNYKLNDDMCDGCVNNICKSNDYNEKKLIKR